MYSRICCATQACLNVQIKQRVREPFETEVSKVTSICYVFRKIWKYSSVKVLSNILEGNGLGNKEY